MPCASPRLPLPRLGASAQKVPVQAGGQAAMGVPAVARRDPGELGGLGGPLLLLLLLLLALAGPARAYNLDPTRPVRFQGPAASFFGYAVLEHVHDRSRW